ncbi:hypothetical protein GCM10025868_40450 [Angustibacter aerolatus]|uniref:Uncharacterized protein n=1 Tax=Angustibacter aerolatus TaxID=1162965 RepID=A0ABQ6JPZ9_9ACTN|nr:hypothetical protein GCM10025868_40450 [Angustibacter aerolatus]
MVNMRALAGVARTYRLGDYVHLGRGEETTGGRDKASILADTVEAIIGCVFLDAGQQAAADLVHRLVDPLMASAGQLGAALDWKTSLQELTASAGLGAPSYDISEQGPDHAKQFSATAMVAGEGLGNGTGRSKKEAEQQAAAAAWTALRDRVPTSAASDPAARDSA